MSRTTFRSQVLVRSVGGTPNSPLSLPAREEVTPNNPVPFRPGKRLLQTIDCLSLEARVGGLGVGLQQVVLGKARDRSAIADAAMKAMMVVEVEPGGKRVGALLGVMVGPGVSPFAHGGLDEAFGFAVGARGIGTSKDVPHPAAAAQVGNKVRAIGGASVGHDARDRDPERLEVIEGAGEEGGGGLLALVGQDFGVGHARMVVDAYVGDLEAGAKAAFLVSAGDPRTDAVEAAELLGVEM